MSCSQEVPTRIGLTQLVILRESKTAEQERKTRDPAVISTVKLKLIKTIRTLSICKRIFESIFAMLS